MIEDKHLPGYPSKKRVREVKSHLWSYGIRPRDNRLWYATWQWANAVRTSYTMHPRWPITSEIGSMYVYLLLGDMAAYVALRLPYRAGECIPPGVRAMLGAPSLLLENHDGQA